MQDKTVPQTPVIPGYHTSPASIAAALRSAADQLELMGHAEISPVLLELNLQAVAHKSSPEQRMDTVDALSIALVGEAGDTLVGNNSQHSNPFSANREDAQVRVYTAVKNAACWSAK